MLQKSKKLMQTERNLLTFVDTIQKLVIFVYTICLTVGVLRVPQTPKHLNECLKCTLSVLLPVSHRSLLPRIPEAKGTSRLKLPDYFAVCDSYPSSYITQFSASIVSLSPAINTDALLPLPSPRAQTHINTYTHENIS